MFKIRIPILIFLLILSPLALAQNPKLKVGIILPLSGYLSDYGASSKNFIEMAFVEYPELKDLIELKYEDSAYDTPTAITAYRKLVSADKVDVIYAFGSKILEGIAPLANTDGVPFFSPEMNGGFASKYHTTFMFVNDIGEFSRSMLHGLREKGYKKILMIRNDNQFCNTWVDGILNNTKNGETAIDYLAVLPGTLDFKTNLLKLRKEQFDALGLFLLPGTQRAFISQLNTYKLKYPLFGSDGLTFKDENKGYYNVIEGALTTALYLPETFYARYVKQYGYNSSITYSVQAYRFAVLMGYISKSLTENMKLDTDQLVRLSKSFSPESMVAKDEVESKAVLSYKFKISGDAKNSSIKTFSYPIANYEIHNGEIVLKQVFNSPD